MLYTTTTTKQQHNYLRGINFLLRFFFLFKDEVASQYVNSFSLGLVFVNF